MYQWKQNTAKRGRTGKMLWHPFKQMVERRQCRGHTRGHLPELKITIF